MTYQQQMKDPRWQKKRLTVLNFRKFKCQSCGCKTEELHVHHPYYKRGAMIWEYDKTELECLCHRCHKEAHAIDEQIRKALALCKDKYAVLDFINSISGQPRRHSPPPSVKPSSAPVDIPIEEDETEDPESMELYKKYPHLAPSPTDTNEEAAEKFFCKMKLIFGDNGK